MAELQLRPHRRHKYARLIVSGRADGLAHMVGRSYSKHTWQIEYSNSIWPHQLYTQKPRDCSSDITATGCCGITSFDPNSGLIVLYFICMILKVLYLVFL